MLVPIQVYDVTLDMSVLKKKETLNASFLYLECQVLFVSPLLESF